MASISMRALQACEDRYEATMHRVGPFLLSFVLSCSVCLAGGTDVAPSAIAAGSPQWIASSGDKSSIDALVDIGSMRQIDDVLEVEIRWPYLPVSYGSEESDKEHIICQADHAISFSIEIGFVSPDGQYHVKRTLDPASEREKAEQRDAEMANIGGGFSSYGSDPRSLACWAAARKCAGESFTWPPPPNETPLEYSDRARKMNSDYNLAFVPTCTLESGAKASSGSSSE